MSLELCVLASGSSGNSAIIRTPSGCLLIDAGIGPRTLAKRLAGTGVSLHDVRALLLTHLDSDHFQPHWLPTLLKLNIKLYAHTPYAHRLMHQLSTLGVPREDLRSIVTSFHTANFSPLEDITCQPIPLAHDDTGSHAFILSSPSTRLAYATDLGRITRHLLDALTEIDILAIEANYDPAMQLASPRPEFLKRRIMGGSGHLSNQQALDCIKLILSRHESAGSPLPAHLVLLHRSRQCNTPEILHTTFSKDPRIPSRLTLAHQHDRTPWLKTHNRPPLPQEQLPLLF